MMIAADNRPDGRIDPKGVDAGRAMEGFFAIMTLWGASREEARRILGEPAERTFQRWRAGEVAAISRDTLSRVGYVAGIFKGLQIVYGDAAQADDWVRRPNRALGGQTPLERMAAGEIVDLAAVRQYVDALRAPWS